jgi:hypothetical protein
VLKVSPLVPLSVRLPLAALNVTCTSFDPTSKSLIEIRLPLPLEKISAVSSATLWAPGTLLSGASLTGVTFTVSVLEVASRSVPPSAVPPSSWTWKVKLA